MPSLREALQSFSALVVTGGSSGIGKSFIELAAKLAPALCVCNLSRRAPVINSSELKLRHFPCDLSRPSEIEQTSSDVVAHLTQVAPTGRVLVINNSGFGSYGPFPEPNLAHQLEMVDVNVRAVIHLTGLLLPWLKTRGGVVMTVASTAAFQPTPQIAAYAASKAYVLHWSLALKEELRGSGVSTLAVCPGPTSSEFFERAGLKAADSSGQSPEAVATEAFHALASGQSQVVTGWRNKLTAAFASPVPKPLAAKIAARVVANHMSKRRERERN